MEHQCLGSKKWVDFVETFWHCECVCGRSERALLPEYPVVMKIFGVGPVLGPQIMAEISDVRRFHSKKALVAFAGYAKGLKTVDSHQEMRYLTRTADCSLAWSALWNTVGTAYSNV